jgi:hypothetical protein
MSFTIRSIQVAVDRLRASQPDATLNAPTTFEHHDSMGAWSFDPIGEWSTEPPFSVLYQQRDPLGYSAEVLVDPKNFVDYCNFGGAVATWNSNGTGRWAHSPGEWIIVDVELVQEQAADHDDGDFDDEFGSSGDYVDVIFALWKVSEGWAAAVWRPDDRDLLAQLIGFESWPEGGWQDCEVWYGE